MSSVKLSGETEIVAVSDWICDFRIIRTSFGAAGATTGSAWILAVAT